MTGARRYGAAQICAFLDTLLVGHPTPAAYGDPDAYTFEKRIPIGWADAYFEGHFGWEFKGRDAQLPGIANTCWG